MSFTAHRIHSFRSSRSSESHCCASSGTLGVGSDGLDIRTPFWLSHRCYGDFCRLERVYLTRAVPVARGACTARVGGVVSPACSALKYTNTFNTCKIYFLLGGEKDHSITPLHRHPKPALHQHHPQSRPLPRLPPQSQQHTSRPNQLPPRTPPTIPHRRTQQGAKLPAMRRHRNRRRPLAPSPPRTHRRRPRPQRPHTRPPTLPHLPLPRDRQTPTRRMEQKTLMRHQTLTAIITSALLLTACTIAKPSELLDSTREYQCQTQSAGTVTVLCFDTNSRRQSCVRLD